MDRLQALIEYVVKGLVDDPDEVEVKPVSAGGATVYEVAVAGTDLGKVIGREGRTANALRQLVRAASMSLQVRATVEILS
jgi:uncharacterized protein